MDRSPSRDITALLAQWRRGHREVEAQLIPLLYEELHRLAAAYLRRERSGHSLQATALVNEAYLRLVNRRTSWRNRVHFFAVAARVMRRILIDHARSHRAKKRGAGKPAATLDEALGPSSQADVRRVEWNEDLIALDEALEKLAAIDKRQSQIVELRFFAGMNAKEIAELLQIGERTVDRDWASAQAWLYGWMRKLDSGETGRRR